jgi:hypothetical protein
MDYLRYEKLNDVLVFGSDFKSCVLVQTFVKTVKDDSTDLV